MCQFCNLTGFLGDGKRYLLGDSYICIDPCGNCWHAFRRKITIFSERFSVIWVFFYVFIIWIEKWWKASGVHESNNASLSSNSTMFLHKAAVTAHEHDDWWSSNTSSRSYFRTTPATWSPAAMERSRIIKSAEKISLGTCSDAQHRSDTRLPTQGRL